MIPFLMIDSHLDSTRIRGKANVYRPYPNWLDAVIGHEVRRQADVVN